jgi:hypothetical protein
LTCGAVRAMTNSGMPSACPIQTLIKELSVIH